MERIFPESDAGPGAKELGCAYYLDGQLAGLMALTLKSICKDHTKSHYQHRVINQT